MHEQLNSIFNQDTKKIKSEGWPMKKKQKSTNDIYLNAAQPRKKCIAKNKTKDDG